MNASQTNLFQQQPRTKSTQHNALYLCEISLNQAGQIDIKSPYNESTSEAIKPNGLKNTEAPVISLIIIARDEMIAAAIKRRRAARARANPIKMPMSLASTAKSSAPRLP